MEKNLGEPNSSDDQTPIVDSRREGVLEVAQYFAQFRGIQNENINKHTKPNTNSESNQKSNVEFDDLEVKE